MIHQLRLLAGSGARRVVLCVGYHGRQIEEVIGNEQFGAQISYSYDGPGLDGTLGAIRGAAELLGDRFLTLYGDTYLRIDYLHFQASWVASGLPAAMAVLRNRNQWEPSNAVLEGDRVVRYEKRRAVPDMQWIDYGLGGLTKGVLEKVDSSETDLAALHHVLANDALLYGYEASNRFYEIGTPTTLEETDKFLRQHEIPLAGGHKSNPTA